MKDSICSWCSRTCQPSRTRAGWARVGSSPWSVTQRRQDRTMGSSFIALAVSVRSEVREITSSICFVSLAVMGMSRVGCDPILDPARVLCSLTGRSNVAPITAIENGVPQPVTTGTERCRSIFDAVFLAALTVPRWLAGSGWQLRAPSPLCAARSPRVGNAWGPQAASISWPQVAAACVPVLLR